MVITNALCAAFPPKQISDLPGILLDQDGARRMSDDFFGSAAHQHMVQRRSWSEFGFIWLP